MKLEFLGTGSGVPGKFRNVACTALYLLNECNSVWLFDVGEGTQQQILHSNLKPRKINKIFITHLHGDHLFGLPGLLSSRSFQGGHTPLTIYGPKGIKKYVKVSLGVSETKLAYHINYVELTHPGKVMEDKNFTVMMNTLDHRIPSFGYRIIEHSHSGTLLVDKLKADHIPSGPLYGQLKRGKTVKLPDGRVIDGKKYLGPSHRGRILAILGDTRKNPHSYSLAKDADVLVHESTFAKNEAKLAHAYYHSTNVEAAELAKRAHVKHLVLTHISARYNGKLSKMLQDQARAVFKNTTVVKDFDQVKVPLK